MWQAGIGSVGKYKNPLISIPSVDTLCSMMYTTNLVCNSYGNVMGNSLLKLRRVCILLRPLVACLIIVLSPHPLMKKNGLMNQVKFLAHALTTV